MADLILAYANDLAESLIKKGNKNKAVEPHEDVKMIGSSMIYETCYGATSDGVAIKDSKDYLEFLESQKIFSKPVSYTHLTLPTKA